MCSWFIFPFFLTASQSDEEIITSSLRSAVLEKISKEQREQGQELQVEVQSLEATQNDLITRRNLLDTYRAQMDSEMVRGGVAFLPVYLYLCL